MKDVAGKTAFVTGGASGIGLGMAKSFAGAGMKVAIADIREDHLDQARAEMADAGLANNAIFLTLDVTDRDAYEEAAQQVESALGNLHVLCNNAGIGMAKSIGKASYQDWDWAVDININSLFNGVHTWLPRIRAHGEGGHVVNTASMAGILQYSGAGIYVATKFAVVGFSEALRAELAPEGIGVSAFCPGGVRSNLRDYEATRPGRFANAQQEDAPSGPPPGFNFSEDDLARLQSLTASPEEAGEIVLQGIRDNALYIFTAPEYRPGVQQRFDAVMRAMGEDAARTRTAQDLIPGLVGSPIYSEK
ncbi:SDR family NAD(P)-dependent oxidoreductase [Alteraurantiacibacter aestuarii]|uniref:SDR family NAD(P)-dependent oxidoreductase n=1 Tax=Alteraurantiacibacter aestuarii TaxID=650004 RepID=A0A844ZLU0_9SPHN|nr:SDR family NAD(P)-dependent oxidoreductase [Alteraurantiacibacter aestuarii]MXO88076.1 SDR family NAD(P)-dependent oxidoreductase [Alteraurantiacibacter aestuarii]